MLYSEDRKGRMKSVDVPRAASKPFCIAEFSLLFGDETGIIKSINALVILARPERFELPTPRFVVWCSIQLSYGREAAAE